MLIDFKGTSVTRSILRFAGMLLLFILAGTAPLFAAERVALVIGNGIYQKVPTLPNPPRDAADIGKALRVRPETSGRIAEFSEHEAD
jgi:hypothetical protein